MYPAYMLHTISFKINAHDKRKAIADRDRKNPLTKSDREKERTEEANENVE